MTRRSARVLSRDVVSPVDVPSFDRSNLDGFAVRAADTYGAQEESPIVLRLLDEVIATAVVPQCEVIPGTAATIATGGMLPRGADAIVMVEHTEASDGTVHLRKSVTPGFGVTFAGTDITRGETVLRRGDLLSSRETGVLAAVGVSQVWVWRLPRVGIISTGDEIVRPGEPMRPGMVYDSNARILADAIRELGGQPIDYGVVADQLDRLQAVVARALDECEIVLLSGGTSKGAGDLSYHVVRQFDDPGIVAHGVALKPGKPICLAATGGKPVIVLPGFPTSAIFTFHEFVAPLVSSIAGRREPARAIVSAELATKVNSEIGRTEYLLVGLVRRVGRGATDAPLVAFPIGKGSGSVTTFSHADGFITIGRHEEIVEAGAAVSVQLLGRDVPLAELVVIGSHCIGLDYLIGQLRDRGLRTKFLAVGSSAGLAAVRRGECDVAGMHLLDSETGLYNTPFLSPELELIGGYTRQQGILFRPDDARFAGKSLDQIRAYVSSAAPGCVMANRNQGSGTRILIDQLLGGAEPAGYAMQSRSHNAVAAAIAQHRADWGVAIEVAARQSQLGFVPLQLERYDFVVRCDNTSPGIVALRELMDSPDVRQYLLELNLAVE